jgi:hypothetical protein
MEIEGSLDCNLNDAQWRVIGDTCKVLEPFMSAQKLLEGENYITISFIPILICTIRNGLQAVLDDPNTSDQIRTLVTAMMTAFRKHWGSGEDGTVATEHHTTGEKRRPKGIPLLALMASLLDPRFKTGPGLSDDDKSFLWDEIKEEMLILAAVEQNTLQQQLQPQQQEMQQQQEQEENGHPNDIYNIIQQMAAANNEEYIDNNNNDNGDEFNNIAQRVSAEVLLYKREPHLALKMANNNFTNPLSWWRTKQEKFPLLAKLAMKYLSIPATSAPSERVFSTAGITIANDRARLDPTGAGELVFLHDATPALKRYESRN